MPRSVHQSTAESSRGRYFSGPRPRQATGCTGILTRVAPISLTFSNSSLFQWPWFASLSGSATDIPRNKRVSPFESTNLFLYTLTWGNSLVFGFLLGNRGYPSFHHPCAFLAAESCPLQGNSHMESKRKRKKDIERAFREKDVSTILSLFFAVGQMNFFQK